jgi:uncharacterized protein YfaS (alpha-2-macroglobulin family)
LRRKLVPAVLASALLILFLAIFLNLTEIDTVVRQALSAVVPQELQNVLRPLRAPMVIDYSPDWEATDVDLRKPVTITFLTPMNASVTEENVTIDPAIAGEASWRGSTFVFTPLEDWPMQQEVTVSVGRDARSWLYRRMERGFTFRFTTLGPPMVVETDPPQDARFAYLQNRLSITFNRAMDHESVETRLSITPGISRQQLDWSGEQLVISGVLKPSTEYRVVIDEGVRDEEYGISTVEEFEWLFTTTERYPYLAIAEAGREALLTAGEPTTLGVSLVNVSRVDVEVYAIDVSTYITMTGFSSEDWRQHGPEELPLFSWSLDPEVELDRDEDCQLELEGLEPGIYYLAASSPEGPRDSQILIATSTALTLKHTTEQALVWATSLEDGQPVAGLAVCLRDEAGEEVAAGVTDEEGVYATDLPAVVDELHAIAEGEDGFGVCSDGWREGVEPWRFDDVSWSWGSQPTDYTVLLYTDRPVYSPGDEVNFRILLRLDDDGDYSVPEVGTSVAVTAANYKGDLAYEASLETSPFGTAHGGFELNPEVAPGEYFLEAEVDSEVHQIVFRIEEPAEEQFAVSIVADEAEFANGDVITATVVAEYDFGAPVAGATVEYTVYSVEYTGPWRDAGDESDGSDAWSSWEYGREISIGTGVTNQEGGLGLVLRAGTTRGIQSQLFTIEATVTDASGQQTSGLTRIPVHRGEFYVRLQPQRFVVQSGQRAVVDVRAVDTTGEGLADLGLSYVVQLSEWREVPRSAEGRTYHEWREITTDVASSSLITDSEGEASISFVPERGGSYQVEAWGRDAAGNRITAEAEVWAGDPDRVSAWHLLEHDRITLVADKESYEPGDVARVLVQSPYAEAVGLVTIERGRILSYEVTELASNGAILEIPVEDKYAPNVFVSVMLVPRNGAADGAPGFKVGYAQLAVEAPESLLRITVTPDETHYEPGQMASYTIRARDYLNQPVSAEVSLAVVDAAKLSQAQETMGDVVGTFRGRRRLSVHTSQSLAIHVDREHIVEDYGGGGGIEAQEPRLVVPEVAYWNPAIVTDENGVARVSFQMPSSLTTWRALVRGITEGTSVGAADVDVVTQKELVIHPSVPGFLSVGDEAVVRTSIENHAPEGLAVQVSLLSTGSLGMKNPSRSLFVAQGDRAVVEWEVTAGEAGSETLTIIANARERTDVVQVDLPILPFGERTEVLDSYVVEDEVSFTMTVPPEVQSSTLEIDLAPSLFGALANSVEYLSDHSDVCVEQTVSRFLAAVALDQAVTEPGVEDVGPAAWLPELVETSLQQLYGLQNRDGGWGWVESEDSQVWQTAYVVYGLGHAQRAGYEVNERVLRSGIGFLQQSLTETPDLEEKAYVSHVLAELGEGDLSLARSLAERRSNMDLYAQAHLALALEALGDGQSAARIVDDVVERVAETAHTAHWTEERHSLVAMSTDGHTTALVLRALLAVNREHPLVAKAVGWLMWNREGERWGSSYETSEIVLSLCEYLRRTGSVAPELDYGVLLNGVEIGSDSMTVESHGGYQTLTINDLASGDNEFTIVNRGSEVVYLLTAFRYSAQEGTVSAARSLDGPVVERVYELESSGEPVTQCRVGDLIRVLLRIELPDEGWYVVVEDPLPAGVEAVRSSVQLSTLEGDSREYGTASAMMGEQAAAFLSSWLPAGVHEYSYLVRATTPGAFRAMPAEVILMYEPKVWGRSGSAVINIGD